MNKILFFTLFLCICTILLGNSVSGIIIDENKNPIEFSNIILHKYNDSTYINGTTTDSLGKYNIQNIDDGNDLFGTLNNSYDTKFLNINSKYKEKSNARFFGLAVAYNFNKGKKFQNTQVNKSNDDEKSRIH